MKIAQAQRTREDSDYDDKYSPSYEKTDIQIKTAEELIEVIQKYVKGKINKEREEGKSFFANYF